MLPPASRLLLIGMGAILLCACGCTQEDGGSKISRRNFDAIHSEMRAEDLRKLLGEPAEMTLASRAMDANWVWIDGDRRIEVMIEPNGYVRASGRRVVKRAANLD